VSPSSWKFIGKSHAAMLLEQAVLGAMQQPVAEMQVVTQEMVPDTKTGEPLVADPVLDAPRE
jgi:hypothetical protein